MKCEDSFFQRMYYNKLCNCTKFHEMSSKYYNILSIYYGSNITIEIS